MAIVLTELDNQTLGKASGAGNQFSILKFQNLKLGH